MSSYIHNYDREKADSNHEKQETQLLVSLVQSEDQRLEASKVTDKFEDTHDSHHSHQPNNLS